MENAPGGWNSDIGQLGWEGVSFSTVYPFLDILNFVLYKRKKNPKKKKHVQLKIYFCNTYTQLWKIRE